MSKIDFLDLVFSLSDEDYEELKEAIAKRDNKARYNATTFEELATLYGRVPVCPNCKSTNVKKDGFTPQGKQRYRCNEEDGSRFTLLSDSIFNSTKKSFETWERYLVLMTFNVPLEMTESLCHISHRTAMLWRKKVFKTVENYQEKTMLRDRVWIDETHVTDCETLKGENIEVKRGLSNQKLCITVVINQYKNVYAKIYGH